jgi:ethanolamine utilization protein EutA (predicted chaperonin)
MFRNEFRSTFTKEPPVDFESKDLMTVKYGGEVYYIGGRSDADFNTKINKSLFEDSRILIYTMLAKHTPIEFGAVRFFTCMPLTQYTKENVQRYKRNLSPSSGYFQIDINGKGRLLSIQDIEIFPEGCAAYYNLTYRNKVLIIDIGGMTVNCALYENGKLVKSKTYSKGMLTLYAGIRDELNRSYGIEEGLLDIQYIIDSGFYPDPVVGQRIINTRLDNYCRDLHRSISIDFTLAYEIVMTGGGSKTVFQVLQGYIPHIELSGTAEWDNALGLGKIARRWWNES